MSLLYLATACFLCYYIHSTDSLDGNSLAHNPCQKSLGFQHGVINSAVEFEVSTSTGPNDHVRLNSPQGWTPDRSLESFVHVTTAVPVLLTGIYLQGGVEGQGRVTNGTFALSQDCQTYTTENFFVPGNQDVKEIVHIPLRVMTFVKCFKLIPSAYTGKTPALRMDLLGCVFLKQASCYRSMLPYTEKLLEGGWRQLTFNHEVVVSSIQIEFGKSTSDGLLLYYLGKSQRWIEFDKQNTKVLSGFRSIEVILEKRLCTSSIRLLVPNGVTTLHHIYVYGHIIPRNAVLGLVLSQNTGDSRHQCTNSNSLRELSPKGPKTRCVSTHNQRNFGSRVQDQLPRNTLYEIEDLILEKDSLSTGPTLKKVEPTTWPSSSKEAPSFSTKKSLSIEYLTQNINPHNMTTDNPIRNEPKQTVLSVELKTNDKGNKNIMQSEEISDNNNETSTFLEQNSFNPLTFENKRNLREDFVSSNSSGEGESEKNDTVVLINDQIAESDSLLLRMKTNGRFTLGDRSDIWKNKTGCGNKPTVSPHERQKRVVQGRQNTPNEWPWLVSLHYFPEIDFTNRSGYKHVCGASLIASDWLIGAAHCFSNLVVNGLENLTNWEVYIGLHDQSMKDVEQKVQVRNISLVMSHSDNHAVHYPFRADVSLIKLDKPVDFTPSISPICLDDTDIFYEKSMCYVTGWGQHSYHGKGSRFPYTTPLSLMTLKECKDLYSLVADDHEFKSLIYVEDPVICGDGPTGEDACLGDSGGPLMCQMDGKWLLTGIVSGGYGCGVKGFPGYYTRVSYYTDWIKENLALFDDLR